VESVSDHRRSIESAIRQSIPAILASLCIIASAETANAAIVNGDPLEQAIEAPNDSLNFKENSFHVFAADALVYDDNVYRLAPDVTDLQSLDGIGPNARRQDYIDTISAGLDGIWNLGRQTITVDLLGSDNRYDYNTNLDNFSTKDKLIWNWIIGSALSGELGATYSDGIISFINTTNYAKNLYAVTNYYGAGRYQLGPHWAIFGGVLEADTTLNNSALQSNDTNATSVDFGSDYRTGVNDSLGLEYRYTDATFPYGSSLNSDYREDSARFVVRHDFSEKTSINANIGFLKRDYTSAAIESFSGDVWRIAAQWLPTEKLEIDVDGWRNLQAYVTAQSDYYVSKGGRISAPWTASEKIKVALSVGYEVDDYIGLGESEIEQGSRRDTLTTAQASLTYTPFQFLIFDFGYAYEKRSSNESQFEFNDNVFSAKVTVKR